MCRSAATLALAGSMLAFVPVTQAQDDYALTQGHWNGLGELRALGRELGIEIGAPDEIDPAKLAADEALLIVYPRKALPTAEIVAFLRRGGRLALADDFGAGGNLLAAFGIERLPPTHTDAQTRLRGNRNLLVARARGHHVLGQDVGAVVTNHPQCLRHATLQPVIELDDDHGAIALVGSVGAGRFVALGDPSILIDNMLQLQGNRTFARNLLRYLAPDGRLLLAGPNTTLVGHAVPRDARRPVERVRWSLERLAHLDLPPAALMVMCMVIATGMLWLAWTALPRRAAYAAAGRMTTPVPAAGIAGRAAHLVAEDPQRTRAIIEAARRQA